MINLNYIVVDLEATKTYYKGQNQYITAIGAVKLDEEGNLTEKFHSYVKPTEKRIRNLNIHGETFITKDSINNANIIDKVIPIFMEWLGRNNDYILVFWSKSDLDIIMNQYISHPFNITWLNSYCDLQYIFEGIVGKQLSVTNAINYIEIEFEGLIHDALYDAYNTAKILKYLLKRNTNIEYDNYPLTHMTCNLYKKCNKCGEIKYHTRFPKKKKKNTCYTCAYIKRQLKHMEKLEKQEQLSNN